MKIWGKSSSNLWILPVALALGLYFFRVYLHGFVFFDDAYMYVRYATHLNQGLGISWNPDGVQTYGCTGLSYLFLIALLQHLPFAGDSLQLPLYTSAVTAALAIPALSLFSLTGKENRRWVKFYLSLILGFVALTIGKPYFYHARTGMETWFAISVLSIVFYSLLKYNDCRKKSYLISAILFSWVTFLTRPESLILLLWVPWMIFSGGNGRDIRKSLDFYLPFFVLLAVDTCVKYLVFGDPVPLPFYAKSAHFLSGYSGGYNWNPWVYLIEYQFWTLPFWILWIAVPADKKMQGFITWIIPCIVLIVFFHLRSVQIMGYHFRFYMITLPLLVFSLRIFDRESMKRSLLKMKGLLLIFICLLLSSGLYYKRYDIGGYLTKDDTAAVSTSAQHSRYPQAGVIKSWNTLVLCIGDIHNGLAANESITASEYGIIGAKYPGRKIIDLIGLHDAHIARVGNDSKYILDQKPALLWFAHPDYTAINASIWYTPEFHERYEFIPGVLNWGAGIRKEPAEVHEFIKSCFRKHYPDTDMP